MDRRHPPEESPVSVQGNRGGASSECRCQSHQAARPQMQRRVGRLQCDPVDASVREPLPAAPSLGGGERLSIFARPW